MKNTPAPSKRRLTTRTLAYSALLCALAIVFARLAALAPNAFSRYSIDSLPVYLAGLLFGPLAGGLVGFSADFIGCLLSPFGYNPVLSVPPILYGVFGGLVRLLFLRRVPRRSLPWICSGFVPPVVLGSILYQSFALAYFYRYDPAVENSFRDGVLFFIGTRSAQFAVVFAVNVLLLCLLFKTGLFARLRVWPPKRIRDAGKITDLAGVESYFAHLRLKGSVPGLERIREMLALMGNPEKKLRFIHLAGTNGKGSTGAMIASVLTAQGYRTGLFTSPCIERLNEQLRINGRDATDAELVSVAEYVRRIASKMTAPPTEFEQLCCMAFEHFRRSRCDFVVLEAGMGGRQDATNVIGAPEVAVLTNIGLDHTDFLGDTLEKIALEKSGIIKPGCRAVLYPSDPGVEETVRRVCNEKNCPLTVADFSRAEIVSRDLSGQKLILDGEKELFLPLLGEHQRKNAVVAITALECLRDAGFNVSESALVRGLESVSWPGRFEIVRQEPLFIIDGGHNPQCFDALAANAEEYLSGKKTVALTGVLADKDYGAMYEKMIPRVSEFICITPPNPRCLEAEKLALHLTKRGAKASAAADIASGVEKALALAGREGAVLCFGSLYSIGQIKAALNKLN